MLIAVLGDIHSNLPALEKVLKCVKDEKVDEIFCTGDIVGYGPYPAECLEIVQDYNFKVTAGNHDYAVAELIDISFFTNEAKEVIEFTKNQLTEEEKQFLASLPLQIYEHNLQFAHSSLSNPELFEYVLFPQDILECFAGLETDVGFFGHTHFFKIFATDQNEITQYSEVQPTQFQHSNTKILVNTGTVGLPRDGNTNTGYILYDTQKKLVSIKRVPYEIDTLLDEMKRHNFPQKLIEQIILGI
jgi:putative phosphoesterase